MPILMRRDRFEPIWKYWHFSDNTKADDNADRLHKIITIFGHFPPKLRIVYKPKQILTLNVRMILWHGRLWFRTYNSAKIVKYGISMWMVCESDTG
jgi:hypothetical protein